MAAPTRAGLPLYLASEQITAILEVRPLIGSYVSVARFRTARELRLVDCSQREVGPFGFLHPNLSTEETEKVVWSHMNRAFSAPVERGDESLDYIPTQILAETFKSLRYDGVGYRAVTARMASTLRCLTLRARTLSRAASIA